MENILDNSPEFLILIFLIITFLQSGIDKITDWGGNVSWLKGHFKETPLKGIVPFMLITILILEVATGILCVLGIYKIFCCGENTFAMYGAILSCVTLLLLLFGQRMAKDYAGAMTIVIYFIPTVFLVYLLQA